MSRYKKTLESEHQILKTLAFEREFSQYDFPEKINKSYRSALRYIESLEKAGLIVLLREEPSEKGGKDKKIYGLTLRGLLEALNQGLWDKIDLVAERHPDKLPLIFGRWETFQEADYPLPEAPELTLYKHIKNVLKFSIRKNLALFYGSGRRRWFREEFGRDPKSNWEDMLLILQFDPVQAFGSTTLKREIYLDVFFDRDLSGSWGLFPSIQNEFYRMAEKDPELKHFLSSEIVRRREDLRGELGTLTSLLERYRSGSFV